MIPSLAPKETAEDWIKRVIPILREINERGRRRTAAIYDAEGNLVVSPSGVTAVNSSKLNGQPASFYRNATNLDSGTVPMARLPVAESGVSSATGIVRADDSRLLDARTPTAHNQAWSTITSTPTTLGGYGITDAAPSSHVGAGGAEHADATTLAAGFLSATDKTKLDAYGSSISTFTPAVTFATPGDLTVSYAAQNGRSFLLGKLLFVNIGLTFTPTFTTASGEFSITGLPTAVAHQAGLALHALSGVTFPAGRTMIAVRAVNGTSTAKLIAAGTGATNTILSAAGFTSGATHTIGFSGLYEIA